MDQNQQEAEPVAARIRALCIRLNLDEAQIAEYLGVPVFTARKWRSGERVPAAVVSRLLDVLGMLEAMAPELHALFVPPKRTRRVGAPRRRPVEQLAA